MVANGGLRLAVWSTTCMILALVVADVQAAADVGPRKYQNAAAETHYRILPEHRRVRRQNGQVVESIFQVPIQTLSAVSNVFKTSIQAIQRQRENFVQATSGNNRPFNSVYGYVPPPRPARPSFSSSAASSASSGQSTGQFGSNALSSAFTSFSPFGRPSPSSRYQSNAAAVGGLPVRSDGSSYRI